MNMSGDGRQAANEKRRLKDKLRKLASGSSPVEDGWRRIGANQADPPLAAILIEIDETLLPRLVSLRNDRGEILRLEAGNRRLHRFVAPVPDGLTAFRSLFEGPVAEPSEEVTNEIKEMLEALLKDSASLWVRTEVQPDSGDAGSVGVSSNALAKAWSIELEARSEAMLDRAFAAFTEAALLLSKAWFRTVDDEVISKSGADAHPEWIENSIKVNWENYIAGQGGQSTTEDEPALCIIGSDTAPGSFVAIARYQGNCVVSLVEADRLPVLSSEWRSAGL